MFKILSKISLFYFILWILSVSGVYYYKFLYTSSSSETTSTSTTSIESVSSWSLKDTIDAVWTAELVDEQSLWFKQTWTVTSVLVKAWDSVKKWDIIATIDDTDAKNSITNASINLENSKLSLNDLYAEVDESKILQSKNTITNAQSSIDIAKKELVNLKTSQLNNISKQEKSIETSKKDLITLNTNLETAQKDLETAQKDLVLTQKQQENTLSNTISSKSTTIKNVEDNFSSELTSISKIIETSDYILWVTENNKYKNDSYEIYLWAKNTSYKTQAETSLLKSISSFSNLSNIVNAYDNSWDITKLKNILSSIQTTYKELENTTDLLYKTLENSIASTSFTESELDNKKSSIYSYKTTVQSKLNSINSTINTLNTLTNTDLIVESNDNTILSKQNSIISKQSSLTQAKLAIEKKEIEIDNLEKTLQETKSSNLLTIKEKENSIENLEKNLEVSKESYTELIEWPTDINVLKAKNNIAQAEINLETAKEKLDDYQLIAPFDWVVRKIDYMLWDNLTTESDKYVYIENPNLLQVTVNLDQVDIAKISVWTKAVITFDSYTSNPADAVITIVDTTPVTTSWVTSYKVTLILDDSDFDKKILSWMTWDVEIIVAEKKDVLVVSSEAITTENDKSYVNLEKNWKKVKTEVVVWISADSKTEIVSWLSLWDKIVITNFTATDSSSTTKSSSLLNLWWNKSSSSSKSSSSQQMWPPGGF